MTRISDERLAGIIAKTLWPQFDDIEQIAAELSDRRAAAKRLEELMVQIRSDEANKNKTIAELKSRLGES